MDPRTLTPTVSDLVKSEIIEIMVRMLILPLSMLQSDVARRNIRNTAISGSDRDNKITPVPSHMWSRIVTTESSALLDEDDNNSINDSSSAYQAMKLFDLGLIKELWKAGDYEDVSRHMIALIAAYKGRHVSSINAKTNEYGGMN